MIQTSCRWSGPPLDTQGSVRVTNDGRHQTYNHGECLIIKLVVFMKKEPILLEKIYRTRHMPGWWHQTTKTSMTIIVTPPTPRFNFFFFFSQYVDPSGTIRDLWWVSYYSICFVLVLGRDRGDGSSSHYTLLYSWNRKIQFSVLLPSGVRGVS